MISLANEVYKGLQSAIPFFIHTLPADEISWKGKREGRIRKLKSRSVDEIFRDRWGISGTFPKDAIEIFWGSVLGRTNISRQSLGYHGIFGGWVLKKSCGHFDFFLILIGGWWIWNGMTQSCTKPPARYVSIKKVQKRSSWVRRLNYNLTSIHEKQENQGSLYISITFAKECSFWSNLRVLTTALHEVQIKYGGKNKELGSQARQGHA